VAQDRLRLLDDGRVVLTMKTAWTDGTQHLVFEPLELLERLAAITPRPRINLVLYHGVLAPVAAPSPVSAGDDVTAPVRPRYWAWADLMRRAFEIDVLACPHCGGRLRLIAIIEDPRVIEAILSRLTSGAERADRAPPSVLSQQARSCRGL